LKKDLKELIKNSGLTFFLRIGGMALGYLASILISRFYGPEVFGQYSIMVTFGLFATMVFNLGIPSAIVKLTSNPQNFSQKIPHNNYLRKAFFVVFFSGIAGSLILFSLRTFFSLHVFHDPGLQIYFLYLSLFFSLLVIHNFVNEYFRGSLQFAKFGLFSFIFPSLILILLVLFFRFSGQEASELSFLAYLIGVSFAALLSLFFLPFKTTSSINFPTKQIFRLSIPMLFSATFIFVTNWTDIFMLGMFAPNESVGIYNAAYKISTLAVIVINVINIVFGPQIAEIFERKNTHLLKIKVQQATRLISLLSLPIFLIILLFRVPLLNLFGPGFVQGEWSLIILLIGMFFNALSGSVSLVLNMTNKQIALRNYTITAAISNLILNYFLINSYGIIGAAIGTTISTFILNLLCIIKIKRSFNFYPFSLKYKIQ
jgi:O-antigen/teichoic acid export membrane protein